MSCHYPCVSVVGTACLKSGTYPSARIELDIKARNIILFLQGLQFCGLRASLWPGPSRILGSLLPLLRAIIVDSGSILSSATNALWDEDDV